MARIFDSRNHPPTGLSRVCQVFGLNYIGQMKTSAARYDVVVIGGALSGAATALLLLRERPELKVLIVEKSIAFGRRVGEATVEVSGYFLCRVLGLTQHLNESHLVKQGMRFWFFNSRTASLADCS